MIQTSAGLGLAVLKECGRVRDLDMAKEMHSQAMSKGLSTDVYALNTVIRMYAKCGGMAHAREVFEKMSQRDVVSWTSLLQGYVENGQSGLAVQVFDGMMEEDSCAPDARVFVVALTALADIASQSRGRVEGVNVQLLEKGKLLHARAVKSHFCNIYVESVLVGFYAKCGSMSDARRVFDSMRKRNVVSWTTLIQGYVDNGESQLALQLFETMLGSCKPNSRTYVAALGACGALAGKKDEGLLEWVEKGESLHGRAVSEGCGNIFVDNMLVNLFAQSGSTKKALEFFNKMDQHNVVSWNCLIHGLVDNGENELALQVFDEMENSGCDPDARTFVAALSALAGLAERSDAKASEKKTWLEKGKLVHSKAKLNRCCNIFVENMVVRLSCSCSDMVFARDVFENMVEKSVMTWSCLIQGYVDSGESDVALELFQKMITNSEACVPDPRTYVAALTACVSLASNSKEDGDTEKLSRWLETGKEIHSRAMIKGLCETFVDNTVVSLYSVCGSMVLAQRVFDNMVTPTVVSWTSLLQGYVDNDENEVALRMFEGIEAPDARCFAVAVKACANLAGSCSESRWMEKANLVFEEARRAGCCDAVVWNCLIRAHVDTEENESALEMINEMYSAGVAPNSGTFVAALMACGNLMALENGENFHAEIRKSGVEDDPLVANCLVDFYGKCGSMEDAKQVFDSIRVKDIWTWNSLISGYSQQGDASQVFKLFEQLKEKGPSPNEITFTLVLSVCSHVGMTELGRKYFDSMNTTYGITPNSIHYTCLVDLLARANRFSEALRVVKSLPFRPHSVIWTVILSACRKWNNVKVGKLAYESLLELDDKDDVAYVLMANIFSGAGMREECERVVASRRRAFRELTLSQLTNLERSTDLV